MKTAVISFTDPSLKSCTKQFEKILYDFPTNSIVFISPAPYGEAGDRISMDKVSRIALIPEVPSVSIPSLSVIS